MDNSSGAGGSMTDVRKMTPEELARQIRRSHRYHDLTCGADEYNALWVELLRRLAAQSDPEKLAREQWVIIATGEGASARVIDGYAPQGVHDFMCFCGKPWQECASTGIPEDIREMEDADKWELDENGNRFAINWRGETGTISLYRLESAILRTALSAPAMSQGQSWILLPQLPDEDTSVLIAVMNEAENHGTGEFFKFPEAVRGTIYSHRFGVTADTDCGEFNDEEILGWQPLPVWPASADEPQPKE